MNWNKQDESRRKELTQELEKLEILRAPALDVVSNLVSHFPGDGYGISHSKTIEWLIANADTVRDALAPFDSGIRVGKG